jgi:hypothetical protein
MQTTNFQAVSGHVNEFVEGLKVAIVTSMAAAAEGIRLESEVARVMQRMNCFHAVLEGIDAQKQAIEKALTKAVSRPQQQSLRLQLAMLDEQTIAVLRRSGIDERAARQSVAQITDQSQADDDQVESAVPSASHHSRRQRRNRGQFAKGRTNNPF